MFDNSGEKKKIIALLDFHAWPVHKDEVEDDKCAPIDGVEFMHKLNQNLVHWEHDYYYFFYKDINLWVKQTKLTSLVPSPTTIEGKIYINKTKYKNLKKKFQEFKEEQLIHNKKQEQTIQLLLTNQIKLQQQIKQLLNK